MKLFLCRALTVCSVAALPLACSPDAVQSADEKEVPSVAVRVARLESGLVPFGDDMQPQWGERARLEERMQTYATPGVGIAIIEDFKVVWAGGYGTLRAGIEKKVTGETLFHAASTAKPIAAAAALVLVERGELNLDTDVNDAVRSWKIPASELTEQEKVTLRRLLSHSAGIEDGFTNRSSADTIPAYCTPGGEAPSATIQQLLTGGPDIDVDGPTRVSAVPGSAYRYANADYAILQILLEDVTGETFAAFMEETVFGLLGMTSSTYGQPLPPALRPLAASEHGVSGEPLPGDRLHIPLLAAGGLWTTPLDMASFLVEIMEAYHGRSEKLLSQAMAREMLAKQIAIPDNLIADAAGLGFELAGEGREFTMVHTGGTWGSTCIVWAYPETGQGAVIMTNAANGSLLRFEILLGIAREFGWPMEQG